MRLFSPQLISLFRLGHCSSISLTPVDARPCVPVTWINYCWTPVLNHLINYRRCCLIKFLFKLISLVEITWHGFNLKLNLVGRVLESQGHRVHHKSHVWTRCEEATFHSAACFHSINIWRPINGIPLFFVHDCCSLRVQIDGSVPNSDVITVMKASFSSRRDLLNDWRHYGGLCPG